MSDRADVAQPISYTNLRAINNPVGSGNTQSLLLPPLTLGGGAEGAVHDPLRNMQEVIFDGTRDQEEARELLGASEYESVCQCCEKLYDRREEPKEVKESGEFICPECWEEQE